MQILIELDDIFYEILLIGKRAKMAQLTSDAINILFKAVVNGTPLPKGHGKLIAEPTDGDIKKTIGGQNDFAECIREAVKAVFDNAQTIIEADKAEMEDKE